MMRVELEARRCVEAGSKFAAQFQARSPARRLTGRLPQHIEQASFPVDTVPFGSAKQTVDVRRAAELKRLNASDI